jgi:hypothetical protein
MASDIIAAAQTVSATRLDRAQGLRIELSMGVIKPQFAPSY